MTQTILARFRFRHGTSDEWTASNEVLLADEGGHEADTNKLKIGDGVTAWNALAYFAPSITVGIPFAVASGTADAIVAAFSPVPTLVAGLMVSVIATAPNASTTPTFNPNGLGALTIAKLGGMPLLAGDIAGPGHDLLLQYSTFGGAHYELINAAPAAAIPPTGGGDKFAIASGTSDALIATFSPVPTLVDGLQFKVRAMLANGTTTPTFNPNGLGALIVTKFGNIALTASDIFGPGHEMILRYNGISTPCRYELINPATRASAIAKSAGVVEVVLSPVGATPAVAPIVAGFFAPFDCTVTDFLIGALTAPTSGTITADIIKSDAATMLSSQPSIAASSHNSIASPAAITLSRNIVLKGDYVIFSLTSVGSGSGGLIGVLSYSPYTAPVLNVTWSTSDKSSEVTLTGANMTATKTGAGNAWASVRATASKSSGKWYFEYLLVATALDMTVGLSNATTSVTSYPGADSNSVGYYARSGTILPANSSYGPTYVAGDVIGVAYDADTGSVWFSKNGIYPISGNPSTGSNPAATGLPSQLFPMIGMYSGGSVESVTGRFKASSFTQTPPAGFSAIDAS